MADFLKNREIEIHLKEFTLKNSQIDISISQGSHISPILYLFYNADLLDIYENIILRINKLKFIDNINILIYNKSIK